MQSEPIDRREASADAETARQAPREFQDSDGRTWRAYERPFPPADWTSADQDTAFAGYGVGWLCFVCGERRRCMRIYPRHWNRLSERDLERLCRYARSGTGPAT